MYQAKTSLQPAVWVSAVRREELDNNYISPQIFVV